MRIVVTGGAGFIASHVSERFVRLGHEVIVVDNLSTGRRANVPSGAQLIEADVASDAVREMIQSFRPEIIDHHAAHADVRESVADPAHDAQTNVLGTISLLHAACQAGVRKFIFVSSGGAIYGDPEPSQVPCTESLEPQPISPYAASKEAGEVYVKTFSRIYGMDYTILRYPNVYGPRQHPFTEEGQVVALFARLLLEGRQPTIFGTGEQERDFAYVGDIADANECALEHGSRGTYNIGTGIGITVNDLYRRLKQIIGYPGDVAYAPARQGEVFRISLNADRARSELGWQPATPFDEGLQRTVEWVGQEVVAGSAR